MLFKQTATIIHEVIDHNTISMLKKGEKYKLFKFKFMHNNLKKTTFCYKYFARVLEEMPMLEIESLVLLNDRLGLINKLAMRPQFETKQDLFKILTFKPKITSNSSNVYASEVVIQDFKDMSKYEYVNLLRIHQMLEGLNLN